MSKTLTGVVLQKTGGFKDSEAWNAGTSPYYVLDIGTHEIASRSAKEGVILRVSESVSIEVLEANVGKKVTVVGEYVEAKPYTPQALWEQYPIDPFTRKPLPRGSGFLVLSLVA
jgi:hypothetical protein